MNGTSAGTSEVGELELGGSYGGLRAGWRGVLPAKGGRDYVYGFDLGYEFGSIDDDSNQSNQRRDGVLAVVRDIGCVLGFGFAMV